MLRPQILEVEKSRENTFPINFHAKFYISNCLPSKSYAKGPKVPRYIEGETKKIPGSYFQPLHISPRMELHVKYGVSLGWHGMRKHGVIPLDDRDNMEQF